MNTYVYSYRRASIFWALILISLGALFLYQNFNPSVHPWQIIAKFWPVLIIFWGVSKLIDYAHARRHPEAAPYSLFSGGEVVLLILLLVLGTMVSKIVLHSWRDWSPVNLDNDEWNSLFFNSYTFTKTFSQPVGAQPHLIVVNRRGDVEIHPSDQGMVEAIVKETIHAESEDEARKLSDQLKLAIAQQGDHYLLQSNLDALPNGGRNVRLDITLHVPPKTSAEITAEHGDISLNGLQGEQSLTANHGDVRVSGVEGLVRIRKSGGDAEVRDITGNVELEGRGQDIEIANVTGTVSVSGEYPGTVQFAKIAQTLRFTSSRTELTAQKLVGRLSMEVGSLEATGLDGPFDLSTREKDIRLEGFKHSVKIVDTNGDISLSAAVPPTHPIEVESKKGEISLALPPNSSFQIDAKSLHGAVECDFSGPALKVIKEGEAPTIAGSVGKGGPLIRLSTAYGTIRLEREGQESKSTAASRETGGAHRQAVRKIRLARWHSERPSLRTHL